MVCQINKGLLTMYSLDELLLLRRITGDAAVDVVLS